VQADKTRREEEIARGAMNSDMYDSQNASGAQSWGDCPVVGSELLIRNE